MFCFHFLPLLKLYTYLYFFNTSLLIYNTHTHITGFFNSKSILTLPDDATDDSRDDNDVIFQEVDIPESISYRTTCTIATFVTLSVFTSVSTLIHVSEPPLNAWPCLAYHIKAEFTERLKTYITLLIFYYVYRCALIIVPIISEVRHYRFIMFAIF